MNGTPPSELIDMKTLKNCPKWRFSQSNSIFAKYFICLPSKYRNLSYDLSVFFFVFADFISAHFTHTLRVTCAYNIRQSKSNIIHGNLYCSVGSSEYQADGQRKTKNVSNTDTCKRYIPNSRRKVRFFLLYNVIEEN